MQKTNTIITAVVIVVILGLGGGILFKAVKDVWFSSLPMYSVTFDPKAYPSPINPEKLRSFIGKSILEIPIAALFDDQQHLDGNGKLFYESNLESIEEKKISPVLYDSDLKKKYKLIIENRILKDVISEDVIPKERDEELKFRKEHSMNGSR